MILVLSAEYVITSELHHPFGYSSVLGLMAVLGIGLFFAFPRAGFIGGPK